MKRRGKVIHVSTIGMTADKLLRSQCDFLKEHGYEIGFVFSPDSLSEKALTSLGFRVHELFISRKISWSDLTSIFQLAGHFRNEKPDIVHTHTSKAGIVGRIAARLAVVPHVVHTIHGFPFVKGQNRLKYSFYAGIERWIGVITEVLLSQSLEDVSSAKKLGIKALQGYPVYIGNGVDTRRFDASRFKEQREQIRSEFGVDNAPVITIVARQTLEKGYAELVDALGQLMDMEWSALFIGGDEGAGKIIRSGLIDHGIDDRVHIMGERDDIERLLAITDIYVLPSYREGVPRSVIEAQAMGIPAVVTNIRGCREVVSDKETGLLVPPKDSKSLAVALRELLNDKELRIGMGLAARKKIEERFDEQVVFQRILGIYEHILQNEAPSS